MVFLDSEEVRDEDSSSAQTVPSAYTGLSVGVMEGSSNYGYGTSGSREIDPGFGEPGSSHLMNTGLLDHTATRVRAMDRDAAII